MITLKQYAENLISKGIIDPQDVERLLSKKTDK
jgi:hypothetical protein